MMEENISAIATPSGKGGVAIIRISGKTALALAEKMFTPTGKTKVADFEPYRMYTGKIDGGNFTDFGLCVYFKAPASYTGEDVVEFHCHGGETIARGILKQTFITLDSCNLPSAPPDYKIYLCIFRVKRSPFRISVYRMRRRRSIGNGRRFRP